MMWSMCCLSPGHGLPESAVDGRMMGPRDVPILTPGAGKCHHLAWQRWGGRRQSVRRLLWSPGGPLSPPQVLEGRGRQARGPWGKGSARAVAVKMTTGHRPREAGKPGTGLAGAWEEWVRDTFVPASDSGQG